MYLSSLTLWTSVSYLTRKLDMPTQYPTASQSHKALHWASHPHCSLWLKPRSVILNDNAEYSLEGLMLKLNSNTLATWCEESAHWKRPWCWERLRAEGEGDDRGWDGWMASPTQWAWVCANSGRWWRTGEPGVLQSLCLQRVRHDLVTEQQQQSLSNSPGPKLGISSSLFSVAKARKCDFEWCEPLGFIQWLTWSKMRSVSLLIIFPLNLQNTLPIFFLWFMLLLT